jgi:subtilisin-like proprotein convertase family protein
MYKLAPALLGLLCLSIASFTFAQTDTRLAQTQLKLDEVARVQLPALDNDLLLEAELAAREPGRAPYFAESRAVDISPDTHGSWALSNDGQQVWRLRISSPGAKSLNLGFDQFKLPEAAQLLLYTPDYTTVMGPFTPADNEEHGELWTPILPGDELVIELQLPPRGNSSNYVLHLKSVNHDFVGLGDIAAFDSGSCNLDVICGAADGFPLVDRYRDIIQSVGVYTANGESFCTGFLVSNARQDCTPFFLTANHCGVRSGNAPSMVVYWNYFNSTCRRPFSAASGADSDGRLTDFNTGAIHRASYSPSDFTLVELDDPVSPTANAWFAGWDARNVVTTDTVFSVHHPDAGAKRISFEFDGTRRSDEFGNVSPSGNFLKVEDWDIGTTEGGSSGAPLFNKQGRAIGKLTGGLAACGNDQYDAFGWLHISWTGGGRSFSRLRDWLDPDNTGSLVQDGYAQGRCSVSVSGDPVQQSVCAPDVAVYQITASSAFTGSVTLSTNGLPAGLQAVFVNPSIMPGGTTALQVSGTENVPDGTYTFTVTATDGTNSRDTEISISVDAALPAIPALTAPADGAILPELTPELSWTPVADAFVYELQIGADADFSILVLNLSSETSLFQSPALSGGNTYYWRVRTRNACGVSDWSAVRSFTLESQTCGDVRANDTPVIIGSGPANTIESSATVAAVGIVTQIRIRDLDITHSYVGDLSATLRSPQGTTIQLFNRPGNGSCFQDNMLITLDDEATLSASDLVNTCSGNPAVSGTFQSVDPLSTFIGEEATGEWTLTIRDSAGDDGGSLNDWILDVCVNADGLTDLSVMPQASAFTACLLDNLTIALTLGADFGDNPSATVTGAGGTFDGFTSTFAPDTRTLSLNWPNFIGNTAGSYPLTIAIEGEGFTNSATVNLNLLSAPEAASLQTPTPDESVDAANVVLSWSAEGLIPVDTFIVEVASDELFDNLVAVESTNQTSLNLQLSETGFYYWRVTARNDCGQSLSNFRRFEALVVGTYELGPAALHIFPNPTRDQVQLELSESIGDQLHVELYTTSGQRLRQWQLPAQAGRQSLALTAIPAGVYWLRVRSADRQAIEKLVVY